MRSIRGLVAIIRTFTHPRRDGGTQSDTTWVSKNPGKEATGRSIIYKPIQTDNIESLSVLNDNKLISDNIGVNEIPYKQTTMFNGNLMDADGFYNDDDYCECDNNDKVW